MENESKTFLLRDTQIQKGVAILILLLLHLFFRSEPAWVLFDYSWTIADKPWITSLLKNGKICVDIFVIYSGFGLNESYNRRLQEKQKKFGISTRFVSAHLVKLYTNFWVIFWIYLGAGIVLKKINLFAIYGEGINGIVALLIDMLGLRDILFEWCHTGTINVTWWFMSAIIIFYLIFPIIKRVMSKMLYLPFLLFLLINVSASYTTYRQMSTGVFFYLSAFALGMLCSELNIMNKLINLNLKYKDKLIYSIILFLVTYILGYYDRFNGELPHAISVILLVNVLFIEKQAILKKARGILEFLGKHSTNIFMFHTFILLYFEKQVYYFRNPLFIYINFIFIVILISILLELIKKYSGFYKLQ